MKTTSTELVISKSALTPADQNITLGHHEMAISIQRLLAEFSISWVSVTAFFWLVIQIVDWVTKVKLLAGAGAYGLVIIVLLSAFLSSTWVIVHLISRIQDKPLSSQQVTTEKQLDDKRLTDTLITDIQNAYDEQKWEEVVKVGRVLSRPLWLTGKYRLRVELGKLVEAAASYRGQYDHQASALIDDLGWTLYVLGDVNEAEKNISHGIQIAETHNYSYLAYKGCRHLSGIAMENGNLEQAKTHHANAERFASEINDERQQKEVTAGIRLNDALLQMQQRQWDAALKKFEEARRIYHDIGDREREVKIHHFLGDVLYELGRFSSAKDEYRHGLAASRAESRKDGILKNSLGLAKVASKEGDIDEVKSAYRDAIKTARELGREGLAQELEANAKNSSPRPINIKF